MSELSLIIFTLLFYIVVREYFFYRQTSRLQELIKASDLSDFRSNTQTQESIGKRVFGREYGSNPVMDSPNTISIDDPEFDISKVTQVNVDGEERPITIL